MRKSLKSNKQRQVYYALLIISSVVQQLVGFAHFAVEMRCVKNLRLVRQTAQMEIFRAETRTSVLCQKGGRLFT